MRAILSGTTKSGPATKEIVLRKWLAGEKQVSKADIASRMFRDSVTEAEAKTIEKEWPRITSSGIPFGATEAMSRRVSEDENAKFRFIEHLKPFLPLTRKDIPFWGTRRLNANSGVAEVHKIGSGTFLLIVCRPDNTWFSDVTVVTNGLIQVNLLDLKTFSSGELTNSRSL